MEYISIVLDVGEHMENSSALSAVESLIQKKLFSESKDELALIYSGTLNTLNSFYREGSNEFRHISVVSELNRPSWDLLKLLKTENMRCENGKADLLEAIYVSAKCLVEKLSNQKLKGKKRIILFSNLDTEIDLNSLDNIKNILIEEIIHLDIVLVDNNDKVSELRKNNETEMKTLSTETLGNCFSFQYSLSELEFFQMKSVAQRGWKVDLEVTDMFTLSLVGYVKVRQVKPPSLKLVYGGDPGAVIETKDKFHLDNGEQTPINPDDIIKGFKYCKSIIPCTDEDIKSMKLEVKKSMKLIGFTEQENVPRNLFVDDGSMFFVVDKDEHSHAFSSLVYSMYACQFVAIVRRIYSKASSPKLGVLKPWIKSDHVSLIYTDIAFGEDIRTYWFPNVLSNDHIFKDNQINAIDNLIDNLMLVEKSDNEDDKELYKTSKMRNPSIQYFYQCAQLRCINPTLKLPELSESLLEQLKPPQSKLDTIQELIGEINKQFSLKVKSNASKKKTAAEIFNTETTTSKRPKIEDDVHKSLKLDIFLDNEIQFGLLNPINDFLSLLSQGQLTKAISNMENGIWQLVNNSYMGTFYPKALLCLHELRKQCIQLSNDEHNFVEMFNLYLKKMKNNIKSTESKKDFWKLVVQDKINLISQEESSFSSVQSEIYSFLLDEDIIDAHKEMNSDDEMNSLFDDM